MTKWFYSRGNQTFGPFPADEIKAWAAKGLVHAEDWVWQEGSDLTTGVRACAAFDFVDSPETTTPVPDWLSDVAQLQTLGPVPPLQPNPELPDWLNDLRLWYGLEAFALAIPPSPSEPLTGAATETPLPIPCDQIPDWLAELLPVAKLYVPPQAPISSAPRAPSAPTPVTNVPAGSKPTSLPSGAEPAAPGKPVPTLAAATSAIAAAPDSRPTRTPASAAAIVPPSIKRTSLRTPKALTRLAEQAIQETGFDPRTGEIVDTAQFQKWTQQKADPGASAHAPTNASIMQVFRKARTAIETWVDDENRRPLILEGDSAAIERDPELQAILAEAGKYGPAMLEKLQTHLAFLIDNRRKYHAAYSAYAASSAKTSTVT